MYGCLRRVRQQQLYGAPAMLATTNEKLSRGVPNKWGALFKIRIVFRSVSPPEKVFYEIAEITGLTNSQLDFVSL